MQALYDLPEVGLDFVSKRPPAPALPPAPQRPFGTGAGLPTVTPPAAPPQPDTRVPPLAAITSPPQTRPPVDHAADVVRLKAQLEHMQRQMLDAEVEHRNVMGQLRSQLVQSEALVHGLQNQCDAHVQECGMLKSQVEQLGAEVARLLAANAELKAEQAETANVQESPSKDAPQVVAMPATEPSSCNDDTVAHKVLVANLIRHKTDRYLMSQNREQLTEWLRVLGKQYEHPKDRAVKLLRAAVDEIPLS